MKKMRYGLIVLALLACSATSVPAQVSIGISLPSVSIGINLPLYPELVLVPGYPVYYAPRMDANYFFYDGMYWVFMNDNWYASSWYNGPWGMVGPEVVPLFILRIPVSYYRQPPLYFRGWQSNAPPRWEQHWGHDWERRRSGWNRWNRGSAPAAAPLPIYQRQYSGDRYPRIEQQQKLRSQQYRYHPRDKAVSQHFKQLDKHKAPVPAQRGKQEAPAARSPKQQQEQRTPAPAQRGRREAAPVRSQQQQVPRQQAPHQQNAPAPQQQQQQHQQQAPRSQDQQQRPQGSGNAPESRQDHGQGQNRDEGRGR